MRSDQNPIICIVNGITYELDPQTGQSWPVDPDSAMSEVEVEQEIQQGVLGRAREVVSAEVRSLHFSVFCPFMYRTPRDLNQAITLPPK
jgi:hypothetical protein